MPTQYEIAEHLDLSQQGVSQLIGHLGIDYKNASLDEIRIAYIRRLREQAAGRATNGDIDLATERAMLAREQRLKIEMQNAVTRGELAPKVLLVEVISKAASKIAGKFDAIPGMVRRRVPNLPAEVIDLIAGEIAKARNDVAGMSLDDLNIGEKDEADAIEESNAE